MEKRGPSVNSLSQEKKRGAREKVRSGDPSPAAVPPCFDCDEKKGIRESSEKNISKVFSKQIMRGKSSGFEWERRGSGQGQLGEVRE